MKVVLLVGLFSLLFPREAHAYLDPGTGSYLLQILAAGVLASLFFFKTWWRRLISFFQRIFRKDQKS
jgi:hypothetical protein